MTTDRRELTVRIPIQWIDGNWQLNDGGKLPAFVDNACADLVMSANCLADETERERWSQKTTTHLLDRGTELFVRVKLDNVPVELHGKLEKLPYRSKEKSSGWVKVVLEGDLILATTYGKKGTLMECDCNIPALDDTAQSVNEAYTKAVKVFEPERRSNAGNVFSQVFLEQRGILVPLNDIREQLTNPAASDAARPRKRSDPWHELATKMSQVYELWLESQEDPQSAQDSSRKRQPRFVFPPMGGNALWEPYNALLKQRQHLKSNHLGGGAGIFSQDHDQRNAGPNIAKFRELRVNLDRAVLEAYGWPDLAADAASELLPVEETGNNLVKDFPRQFRWRAEFRRRVLARLISLDEQRHPKEPLVGRAVVGGRVSGAGDENEEDAEQEEGVGGQGTGDGGQKAKKSRKSKKAPARGQLEMDFQ